ncbi:MAG TPA: pilus assembly protein PilM [Candidatus Paceibacterota bacterium]|nr:pilus assembly protein PilM [Candidatus Paceibacterota bacterium]
MAKKFFEYFPPPVFLQMPYAGLHLSPHTLRLIEFKKGKKTLEVGSFSQKQLDYFNAEAPLAENKQLVEILRQLKKENKLKFVKTALPDEKSYVFTTEIPNTTDKEIRTFIEFHLEENVPLSLEEAIFDYHLLEPKLSEGAPESESKREAIVSVLPRETINQYVELLKKADLMPLSFSIEAQAIARAVIKNGDAGTYLVINIDDTKTGFSVVSNERVQFNSSLAVGSDNFTQAIAKQFKVDVSEAEKIKKQKGFIKTEENTDVFFALVNVASVLKDEIERIFSYWHTHTERGQVLERQKIQKVYLLGREASIIGFKEYLAETVRMEVEIANVWSNAFSFDQYIPPVEAADALNFGAAIGLALPTKPIS